MDWQSVPLFVIGVLSGFLTVTAGAAVTVVIPVLLWVGLSADEANATSRLSLAVGGTVAAGLLMVQRKIDWSAIRPLLGATAAGTIGGALFGARINSAHMLTIIVVTSAVSMALVYLRPHRWLSAVPAEPLIARRYAVFLFFLLCLYEGMVAVDSALLRLIALVYLLGYPLAAANPIKLITGLVMFGVSSLVYARAGQIDWAAAAWLGAGTVLGAVLAVPVACSVSAQKPIYRLLQVVVTLETIWLIAHWARTTF